MTLYRGMTVREAWRANPANPWWAVVVGPFVPWSLGARPDWLPQNIGDWVKEDLCRRK
jgi:hypothetical protein